ncbi:MAG: alpha/beta fold hydrolase [Thiobacillaceae bacterium]
MKSKPTLALLHGWGMNPRVFDALATHLADHFELLPLALPGHGGAELLPTNTLTTWAARISAQLPRQTTLLGWSLGGQVAMRIARDVPAQIERLILLSSTPKFVLANDWQAGIQEADLTTFGADLQHDARATLLRFLTLQTRGADAQKTLLNDLRTTFFAEPMAQAGALSAGLSMLLSSDLRVDAVALSQPTLVMHGGLDKLVPALAGTWLAHTIPGAHFRMIERAAHAPLLSHPQQVAEAILEWTHG